MTEMDSFFERLDDSMYGLWKLKNDTELCNLNDTTHAKVTAKLEEAWNILNDVEILIRYEKKEKNNDK